MSIFSSDRSGVSLSEYYRQGIKSVKTLMSEDDFDGALELCDELMTIFRDDPKIFRLREKAYAKWRKKRWKQVAIAMKKARPLWKSGKYTDLLQVYAALDQFLPDCSRIQNAIFRIHARIDEVHEREMKLYIRKGLDIVSELKREKAFSKAMDVCHELLKVSKNHPAVLRALLRTRREYVDYRLGFRYDLIRDKKFEELLHMYSQLLKLTPDHGKLHRLIRNAENGIIEERIFQKKEFIEDGLMKIRELYEKKRYRKGIAACKELLGLDKNNFRAKRWYRKCERADFLELQDELADQMISMWAKLWEEIQRSIVKIGAKATWRAYSRI